MENFTVLQVSIEEAERIALQHYGIQGEFSILPGEVDFNFKVKTREGTSYILKISRPDADRTYLEYQQKLLVHIAQADAEIAVPKLVPNNSGEEITKAANRNGDVRMVRLVTWVDGRIYHSVNPQLDGLRESLGASCGKIATALQNFDHPYAQRDFDWDIAQSLWTTEFTHLFSKEQREIITYFQERFRSVQPSYKQLRKGVVHNDANDHNVIVTEDVLEPKVKAVIDYGDAICTQYINDVAVACAYAVMDTNDPVTAALPLVKGYHEYFPLQEKELEHLYIAIAMRLIISVTKSALNKQKEPHNAYLQVSEKPAWELLRKWRDSNAQLAYYSFRAVCGYAPHPNHDKFEKWAKDQEFTIKDIFPETDKNGFYNIDLSVSSKWLGHENDYADPVRFQFKLDQLQAAHPDKMLAGGYLEPRYFYDTPAFYHQGNNGLEYRTVHMGVDFWAKDKTSVHAILDGEILTAADQGYVKGYGGLVIVKHHENELEFFTLYGHLSKSSISHLKVGDTVKAGDKIGALGSFSENGNWIPHLHFQILLDHLSLKDDFPGVGYYSKLSVIKSLCPDPNLLFRSKALNSQNIESNRDLLDYRKKHLGKSLSLQYEKPLQIVRGSGVYLIDQYGRRYLDTVNNVAHVGHENYRVVKAGQEQMALLNTNSRYLHPQINTLAKHLLDTLPKELSVLHFVNSGSEANELAIRMVKANTSSDQMIVSEVGYHGNTNACIDISSYKFDGKGGSGAPEHTHVFPLPDVYRGKYRGNDRSEKYAQEVQKLIDKIHRKDKKVGAVIIESIISCGGQIELPKGFLSAIFKMVRKAGGLCISDEVQVGCGRVGEAFWGFQLHGAVPDIVTIGKPLGNGHPLAAVACTPEVAEKFANGMEYFNTFGGNPVSCAIGTEVLKVVKEYKLQENAKIQGDYLKEKLWSLAKKFPILGDVRGRGLFLGFELVDFDRNPLPEQANYLKNRMKDFGILMSTDGPDNNVLKIKPPLVFNGENADTLLFYLEKILAEDFMLHY